MSISLRVLAQCTWFNVRLKAHHQAVRTHYQRDSYDIFSWLYTFMIRGCFLYLGTVYIGWKTIEISKTINVMKIVLASFLFIFSYWCVGRLWFFYWRNDWNQEYLSDTLNIFVKCTENFSEAFENNKQVSAETEKPCQNVVTPFLMAFLPHVFDECSQPPGIFSVDFTIMFNVSARSTSCSSLH